jgi:hypothetical protein
VRASFRGLLDVAERRSRDFSQALLQLVLSAFVRTASEMSGQVVDFVQPRRDFAETSPADVAEFAANSPCTRDSLEASS